MRTRFLDRTLHVCAAAAMLCFTAAVRAQSEWPDYLPTMKAAESKSPVAAPVPADAKVEPPPADFPADKARWSGKFAGWACSGSVCDTKLVVEKVTVTGAEIIYSFASASFPPRATRLSAQFVGDELHGTLPSGSKLKYRMRSTGEVEFHLQRGQTSVAGILVRE